MKKFIFSLFVVGMAATFLCTTSSAGVKTVSGNVTDKLHSDPIENATIHPHGMTVWTTTDSRGFYEISFYTTSSNVTLIAEASDYDTQERVASGELCNFSLMPHVSIQVIAGYVWDFVLKKLVPSIN